MNSFIISNFDEKRQENDNSRGMRVFVGSSSRSRPKIGSAVFFGRFGRRERRRAAVAGAAEPPVLETNSCMPRHRLTRGNVFKMWLLVNFRTVCGQRTYVRFR